MDGDGEPDVIDKDDDNDGIPDEKDPDDDGDGELDQLLDVKWVMICTSLAISPVMRTRRGRRRRGCW